jgi:chromatin remodeling complex protein RSC6
MSAKTTKTVTPAATTAATPAKKEAKPAAAAPAAPVAAPAAPVKKVVKKAEEAPAAAPVAAPAPVVEKKVEAAPAPVVEAVAAPAAEAAAAPATEGGALGSASEEKLKVLAAKIAELSNALKEAANEMKVLQRQVAKDFKEAAKAQRSRRGRRQPVVGGAEKAKRSPSGFAKPTGLTDALCTFLGLPSGTQLARTDVTKKITEYIKTHNLQNPENKKIIIPDATLGALLENGSSEVTYFNLQKFLKVHFVKTA